MDGGLFIVLLVFFLLVALMVWVGLHFGSRWFAQKQQHQASQTAVELESMFIFTGASRVILFNIVLMILLPVLAWFFTGNIILVGIFMIAAFFIPRKVLNYLAQKRLRLIETQLPDAILMLVGALRAGASLGTADQSPIQSSFFSPKRIFSFLFQFCLSFHRFNPPFRRFLPVSRLFVLLRTQLGCTAPTVFSWPAPDSPSQTD